jgi:hypothetical protein
LDHDEEIGLMMFPAHDRSADVVQPGEGSFAVPAPTVTPQSAVILGFSAAVGVMGSDLAKVLGDRPKRR